METMTPTAASREQVIVRLRNRLEKLDKAMADLIRGALPTNDTELQVRVERAKKSVAEKGKALESLLAEAESVGEGRWPDTREELQTAWVDYEEAVDRARLDLERAEELS